MSKSPEKNANNPTGMERENTIPLEQMARLQDELEQQKYVAESMARQNAVLQEENASLREKIRWMEEKLITSTKRQFGASSERVHGQISIFGEVKKLESKCIDIKQHQRKKRRTTIDSIPEGIPTEIIECELPEEERICPQCGESLRVIGKDLARQEVVVIPAKVVVRKYYQYAYACRRCEKMEINTPVLKGRVPNAVIKGGNASSEAIAYIMTEKFLKHMPLARQETSWKLLGIIITRQTMSGWIIKAAEEWLEPLYELLKSKLLEQDIVQADETRIRVIKDKGGGYIWIYRTGALSEYPIVIMEYQPGRSGKYAKDFFKGYEGKYLMVDGYDGYNGVPETVTRLCCWSHARRYWLDAVEVLPKNKREGSMADIGFSYCERLFYIERELAELTAEERYEKRLEMEKPILDEFIAWVKGLNPGKSKLGTAARYTINQWANLCNFLHDGRLSIHNNIAEQSARVVALGRKNYLFCNTARGAKAAAMIYTIIETAKAQGLNVYEYLKFILTDMPNSNRPREDYLPGSACLPEECYIQPACQQYAQQGS